MDLKITNFDVTTEEVKLSQQAEIPIDFDISLSDYEPSIKKILKCCAVSNISLKQISGNCLNVEGTATLSVIYCDQDNLVFSVEKEIPFKKIFESSTPLDGGFPKVTSYISVQSVKAMTEKRFSIKAQVTIEADVTAFNKTLVIADLDNDCFEQLSGTAKGVIPIGCAEKSFIIDEELVLDDGLEPIGKIISSNYNAYITETKIISNKIVVKGILNICIFYRTNKNSFGNYKTQIPFNQIVDLNGTGENCSCDVWVDICSLNLTTRTSQNGECKTVMLVAKILATAKGFCENEIPVIYDLYSKKFETEITKKEVLFNQIVHQSKESFICKKTIAFPENGIKEIINLWCEKSKCIPHFNNSGITVSGTITVCAFYRDNEDEVGYFERIIDFEYPIETNSVLSAPVCNPTAEILNTDYALVGNGDVELSLELQLSAAVYDSATLSVICAVDANESKPISHSASLVAYYAEKGESVWKIAKSFLADKESFLELNDIKEDTISASKMLIIPRF